EDPVTLREHLPDEGVGARAGSRLLPHDVILAQDITPGQDVSLGCKNRADLGETRAESHGISIARDVFVPLRPRVRLPSPPACASSAPPPPPGCAPRGSAARSRTR